MAKFLDTTAVSHELTQLIKSASDQLFLISPYLQIAPPLKDHIKERDTYKIPIFVIYGKQDRLNPEDMSFLQELQNCKVYFCENLHAKCYLNEKRAIITSMNLYAYSAQNNREMGILIEKETDPALFEDIFAEVKRLRQTSIEPSYVVKKKEPQVVPSSKPIPQKTASSGFCIRCHLPIKFDMKRPLCDNCFTIWAKFSDQTYQEKYCHRCGNAGASSYEKPVCYSCFKKLK